MRLYFLASDSSGTYDSNTCYLLNWYYDSAHSRYTIINNYQEPLLDDNGCSAGYWSLSLYFNAQETCVLEAMDQADTKYPNSDLIDLSKIEYDNANSGLSADYVSDAIDELDARKSIISTTWNDITNSTSPLPNTIRYTGKEIHCIANDVDASLSDNDISSTQYAGMYVRDGEKNNIGKCAVDIYNTGMVEMQLYAQNKGTGSNVSNYLSLQVANDGTRSISVNAPEAWRQAIGPKLLTNAPSLFSDKTISTGGSWTNLGS